MRTILKTTCATAVGVAFAGVALADGHAQSWDMPMAYAATNFHSEHGVIFADKVREYTDGAIDITEHAGGSLFGGGDIKRAIQTGQVPIGERFMSAHANEAPLLGWDNLPFIATSYEDNAKLWDAAKDTVNAQLADLNLVALYTCPWPGQGFYFNKEVASSADTQGIKFRSYNNATSRLAELTGMLPVTIEAAEISQAFATGVADSMVSSGATGYDRKVWESLNYFYEVDAWLPRNYIMINSDTWDGVSDANKNVINACARMAEYAGTWRAKEYTGFTMAGLAAGGMTVERASEGLMAELKEVGATMSAEWLEAAGEAGQAIIDAYNAE